MNSQSVIIPQWESPTTRRELYRWVKRNKFQPASMVVKDLGQPIRWERRLGCFWPRVTICDLGSKSSPSWRVVIENMKDEVSATGKNINQVVAQCVDQWNEKVEQRPSDNIIEFFMGSLDKIGSDVFRFDKK